MVEVTKSDDPIVAEAVESAMRATNTSPRHRKQSRSVLWLLVVLLVVGVGYMVLGNRNINNHVNATDAALAAERSYSHAQSDALRTALAQLRANGITPAVTPPTTSPASVPAVPPARGIVAVSAATGKLVVVYTDGTSQDVGSVTGATGATGAAGVAGRGIASQAITNGHLIVNYTDGSSQDVGTVVGATGPQGRSVASVVLSSEGHLVVSFSDNTTQDLGSVVGPAGPAGVAGPAGPSGAAGADGQPPVSWTYTYNDALGNATTMKCVRSDPFDASNPTYTCAPQS